MNDIAIRAENLSKYYRLGVINNGTLFRDIQSWWALKRGKEDPHAKIGSIYDPTKEGFWALKGLNFEIKKGDRVGIIGHNGAGKSTLLKILSGITVPTKGCVKINGRISSLLEVGTGFHPEMTGRENIYLNGAILGMKKSEIDKKIDEIIEFSEIKEHIDTPVKRYSSGMYVRLAFAVAAHLDSDILIADEVLAVGDAAFQKKALGKMNSLSSSEGRTVLFVSHNMDAIKELCNKGLVLDSGKIVKEDDDIDNCISYYLGRKSKDQEFLPVWKNDGSFYNDLLCPLSFELLDENGNLIRENLDYNKDYKLKVVFSVSKKSIKPISFYIKIYRESVLVDNLGLPVTTYEAGTYEAFFFIHKNQLNPGAYTFAISVSVVDTAWIVNIDDVLISLNCIVNECPEYTEKITGTVNLMPAC